MSTDNFTCPVLEWNLTVTQAVVFENTNWIVSGHNRVPRFGHTNNITSVIEQGSNNDDIKNYVIGLSAASIAIFSFFCLWLIIVVILKCMGHNVVGFCSGGSVRIPPPPSTSSAFASANASGKIDPNYDEDMNGRDLQDVNVDGEMNASQDYDEDLEKWKNDVRVRERRIRNIRIAVIIAGVLIVIFSILMLVFGITSLNDSVKDGRDGLAQGESLANDAVTLIDNYLYRQNSTLEAAQNVQQASKDVICPNLRDVICSDASTFDCDYILDLGSNSAVTSALNEIVTQLVQVRSDLVEVAAIIDNIDQQVTKFNWAFWVAAGAVILMAICTILILNGVILAWQNKLRGTCWQRTTSRIRGWCIVPVFILLLVIGWAFSMVFVMGYTATSDFCYNSPDENVQAILAQYKDKFSSNSIVYPTILFYVNNCGPRTSPIFQLGEQFLSFMSQYLGQAIQAIDVISSGAGTVASECGTNPETLQSALLALESQVCTVASTIYDLIDFFTCENFNTLYATVAYSAICYNGNTGFVWIAFTQFMIILCAMIMLTLRVAFYELVDESELIQVRRGCCPCGRSRQQAEDDHFADDAMEEDEMEEPQKYHAAKNTPETDLQSKRSGDGFDEIVSSAVGEAFYENEQGGKASDKDEKRS